MERITISELESALLGHFPQEMAEPFDRTGLLVGDPHKTVTGVLVALDPSAEAIRQAVCMGANVLLTHHPAYLTAPSDFKPAASPFFHDGALVYEAIASGVALMNFHTALDFAPQGACALAHKLGLSFQDYVLVKQPHTNLVVNPHFCSATQVTEKACTGFGYGSYCALPQTTSVAESAAHIKRSLGRQPRCWGNAQSCIDALVIAGGSGAEACEAALQLGVTCAVVGEIKYHTALSLVAAGQCIIELGHDVSELPLVRVLYDLVNSEFGNLVPLYLLEQNEYWF